MAGSENNTNLNPVSKNDNKIGLCPLMKDLRL